MSNDKKSPENAVFPVKFSAKHKTSGKVVLVLSTGIINTTDSQEGELMVMYSDGTRIFCRESGEFNQRYLMEKDYD